MPVRSLVAILVLSSAFILTNIAYVWTNWKSAPVVPSFVSAESLDFGVVAPQADFRWKIPFHNPFAYSIRVSGIRASCQCTKLSHTELTLDAGEKREVDLVLDLSSKVPPNLHTETIPVSVEISALIEATGERFEERTRHWMLKGKISTALSLSHARVFFGESDNIFSDTRTFRVKNIEYSASEPLSSIDVSVNPDLVTITHHQSDPQSGMLCIQPKGNLPAGTFECVARIEPVRVGGDPLPCVDLRIEGVSLGEIAASPQVLSFPPSHVGESVSDTVVVWSRSGKPFSISAAELSGNVEGHVAVSERDKTYVCHVSFAVTDVGKANPVLDLSVEQEERPLTRVSIPIRIRSVTE